MRRRQFLSLLCGGFAATGAPLIARAQSAVPVVGFLNGASPAPFAHLVAAFKEGLKNTGYTDGNNVLIEYRWAEGHYDRLPEMAAELVRRPVAVIATTGGHPPVRAAMAATKTIPIVFGAGSDPVKEGYVASINRPGGNVTGTMQLTGALAAKRIGLLLEMVPNVSTLGVLINPNFPVTQVVKKDSLEAAAQMNVRLVILEAATEEEFEPAFEKFVAHKVGAIMVGSDPFFNSRRNRLVALSARYRIPAIYEFREFAMAGGLMSYGTRLIDTYRQVGNYVGRILKGESPATLPVVQSARFEFVVNLKAAREQGFDIPPMLLARADEVIE